MTPISRNKEYFTTGDAVWCNNPQSGRVTVNGVGV